MAKLMRPDGKTKVEVINPSIGTYFVTLRNPTNEELNNFDNEHVQLRGERVIEQRLEIQTRFFDLLLDQVDDLSDWEGNPVGPDRKDLIPRSDKFSVVTQLFRPSQVGVLEKN